MIVIAQPYAYFRESVSESSLELAAQKLLQLGELKAKEFYLGRLPEGVISVEADIELGSTKTWIAVSTLATVLITYGDIRQSIDYLIKDAKFVGDLILPNINSALGLKAQPTVKQRRL